MNAATPFVRIALRYIAGVLLAHGLVDAETGNMIATDPDLIALLAGGVMFAVTEGWFLIERRK